MTQCPTCGEKMDDTLITSHACSEPPVRISDGLDDALGILINISKEYSRFCDVMLTMPERPSEVKAGSRFMDSLENLRDELLKRKSSNDPSSATCETNQ